MPDTRTGGEGRPSAPANGYLWFPDIVHTVASILWRSDTQGADPHLFIITGHQQDSLNQNVPPHMTKHTV